MTAPAQSAKPPFLRRQLAIRLTKLREVRAKLTQDEVSRRTGLARSAISDIENAKTRVREATIRLLLGCYGVTAPELDMFIRMAKQAGRRGAYLAYKDVTPDFAADFFELEAAALEIRSFSSGFIPGLFQDEEYVRRITKARHPERSEQELDRSQQLRAARQKQVLGTNPPRLHVIIDEVVLQRGVTAEQVDRLIVESKRPEVTLQVLPVTAGEHPAMGASFDLLRLSDEDDAMEYLYQDNLLSAVYHEEPDEIEECVEIFNRLAKLSLSPKNSVALLVRLRGALGAT